MKPTADQKLETRIKETKLTGTFETVLLPCIALHQITL